MRLSVIRKIRNYSPEERQDMENTQTSHLGNGRVLAENVSEALGNVRVKGIDSRDKKDGLIIIRVLSAAFGAPKALEYFGGSRERMIEAQEQLAQLFSDKDTDEERAMDEESRQRARSARYYRGARQLKDLLKFSISGYDAQGLTFDDDSILYNMKNLNSAGTISLSLEDLIRHFPSIIDESNEEDKKLLDSVNYYTEGKNYAGLKRNFLRDKKTQLGYAYQVLPESRLTPEQLNMRQDFDMLEEYRKNRNVRLRR